MVASVLAFWLMFDVASDGELQSGSIASHARDSYQSVLPIYRGVGCLILLWWCYGVNCWVWTRYRIAYLALFELDARTHMPYPVVFEHCVNVTLGFEINLLLYRKVVRGEWSPLLGIPPTVYPVLLFIACAAKVIWHLNQSLWLRAVKAVLLSPFSDVTFIAAYMGDIFTSLIKVFIDIAYAVCYTVGLSWLYTTSHPTASIHSTGFGPGGTASYGAGQPTPVTCADSWTFK